MRNWREDVWFFDTETLPNDWLFCAQSVDGGRVSFHNDNLALQDWLSNVQPFLCGYNSKHYDQFIVKAILAGGTPQEVKEVNDAIIVDGIQGWSIDMGWIVMPEMFDLMLDLPTMPSLKLIEGNLKMSIEESGVSFNCQNPTASEWDELVQYCWHDVEALAPLYKARMGYLEAKETLAEMVGMDVRKALNMTNAKLTAKFLGAVKVERDDERVYEVPSEINMENIPKELLDFFSQMKDASISSDILFKMETKIELTEGCLVTYGWGGCHQSVKNYEEETSEKAY